MKFFSKCKQLFLFGGLVIFSAFVFIDFIHPGNIIAQNCDEIVCSKETQSEEDYLKCNREKQSCWEQKVSEAQNSQVTLKNTINIINGQIILQTLQIEQTTAEVERLQKEVEELSQRISGLSLSLDRLSAILIERIQASYKQKRTTSLVALFTRNSFNNFVQELKYLKQAQSQTAHAMRQAENQRLHYHEQKTLKEEKQAELDQKKVDLQKQKNVLDSQKDNKNNLLVQTKNNETIYQQKLAEATAELNSLKNYSSSKSDGVISAQNSPDGWYYSQRDERWAYTKIGMSNENIMDVGCLISSTAMMMKCKGENINPITIANNNNYFWSPTAYMDRPWPSPNGYSYAYASKSQLDNKLAENPVIVKLSAGPYGTHFIVIKEKKGDDYIIHDPWEGYDKLLSSYYSISQIIEVAYLVK